MGTEVLLYVPNIIGYVRILLVILAFVWYENPEVFVVFYYVSIALDGFDGYAARKLNQVSAFGALFDIVIDLFTRGLLWCSLYQYGYVAIMVEWLTFMSTHHRGPNWKIPEESFPTIVKKVMADGFKTPLGVLAVGSLHILPIWLYGIDSGLAASLQIYPLLQILVTAVLIIGRLVCLCVELFYIQNYLCHLLNQESKQ